MLTISDAGKNAPLKMGDITLATGVSDQTVRYYERMGLIQASGRTSGGFRLFHSDTIQRIRLVKEAQALGFSLNEIKILVKPSTKEGQGCESARIMLRKKAVDLDALLNRIRRFADLVSRLEDTCHSCSDSCHLHERLLLDLMQSPSPSGQSASGALQRLEENPEADAQLHSAGKGS